MMPQYAKYHPATLRINKLLILREGKMSKMANVSPERPASVQRVTLRVARSSRSPFGSTTNSPPVHDLY
jgi:hypothetical protein